MREGGKNTLNGLEVDLTDIPRIEYRYINKTWIAKLFIKIPYDSNPTYSRELLKIGYCPTEKVEDPLLSFKFVLLKDGCIEAIAEYSGDYLNIIGTMGGVKGTYEHFLKNGVFYNINIGLANVSKGIKFLIKHQDVLF